MVKDYFIRCRKCGEKDKSKIARTTNPKSKTGYKTTCIACEKKKEEPPTDEGPELTLHKGKCWRCRRRTVDIYLWPGEQPAKINLCCRCNKLREDIFS